MSRKRTTCDLCGREVGSLKVHRDVEHGAAGPSVNDAGELVCPQCGAVNQFKEYRAGGQFVTLGVGAFFLKPSRLRCVACGGAWERDVVNRGQPAPTTPPPSPPRPDVSG